MTSLTIQKNPDRVKATDPEVYRALTIASALRLYARTGIKANRAYTPKAMMAMAGKITGQTFRAKDYLGAATALKQFCREL